MFIERDEKFEVTINLEKNGEAFHYKSVVLFSYNPSDYGNGYYMYIKSKLEPFGGQSYDLRYDSNFHSNCLIKYVIDFYLDRYDGVDTRWGINSIKVVTKEFIEP